MNCLRNMLASLLTVEPDALASRHPVLPAQAGQWCISGLQGVLRLPACMIRLVRAIHSIFLLSAPTYKY